MAIADKIRSYHMTLAGHDHHRYRSWEHCYRFFRGVAQTNIAAVRDSGALQLGFYLASWGMYRGSSFLLQHDYTVHLKVVDALTTSQFSPLWEKEFGAGTDSFTQVPAVLAAAQAVRNAYAPFGQPTDTLVTKVLLGTLGCLPACDRFFLFGFKSEGFSYSYLNKPFVERLLDFCQKNTNELREEQARIASASGLHYPIMKLVDMYFWQIGYEAGVTDAVPEQVA
jgi:hypothetical protein